MNEMVERVARAMQSSKAWPVVFQAGSAQELARAAIAAMREPTEVMVTAGAKAIMASGRASNACHAHRAAIDAALSGDRPG